MERYFYFIGIAFFGMVNGLFNQTWLAVRDPEHANPRAQHFCSAAVLTLMFASLWYRPRPSSLAAFRPRSTNDSPDSRMISSDHLTVDLARRMWNSVHYRPSVTSCKLVFRPLCVARGMGRKVRAFSGTSARRENSC